MDKPLFLGYSPISVANFIIELSIKLEQENLTILKLLKLCYISHGFTLAVNNRPLVAEHAQVWEYGPVFPSIYHAFKIINPPITNTIYCQSESMAENDRVIIKLVNKKYGTLNGLELSALTHAKGTPWAQAKNANKTIIDNKIIKDYYKQLPQNENN